MEKNFITKESVSEILTDISNDVLDNCHEIYATMEIVCYTCHQPELVIRIYSRHNFKQILERRYSIIDKVYDSFDVADATTKEAIARVKEFDESEETNEIPVA